MRWAVLLAAVLVLVQLAALAAPPFAVLVLARRAADGSGGAPLPTSTATSSSTSAGAAGSADRGADGARDPYFPDYGAGGYDALRYRVDVSWDRHTETLTGNTTMQARADQPLRSFSLDLALTTTAVRVDGRPASFHTSGFQDLQITPAAEIARGSTFEVEVDYHGRPTDLRRGTIAPCHLTGDELLVAGEPEASAWWFPADDHPSDPALMDVTVQVPTGWQAISTGRLAGHRTAAEGTSPLDTWHWVSDKPSATYLTFLAIGHFDLRQGVADGRPFVYAVSRQLSGSARDHAFGQLERTPAVIAVLETLFGPYPFAEIGGIVPAGRLWFDGLEAQTRPVYAASAMTRGDAGALLSHELTHMWFGDNVTLSRWDDIFDNEAWASWGSWAYAERTGGPSAEQQFLQLYQRAAAKPRFWRIDLLDPGPDHLFDVVYYRGPMALQALRNRMGAGAFSAMARAWAQQPGTRNLEQWMITAQHDTPADLTPFFQAWVMGTSVPARTPANGFPG